MQQLTPAQVLSQFMWKNMPPKNLIEVSQDNVIGINQNNLLPYLMQFQQFVFDNQPAAIIPIPQTNQ